MLCDMDMTRLPVLVAREQLRLLYRHLPAAIVPPILAAALIAFVFRDQLPHGQLWLWVVWVALSYALLPGGLCIAYRKTAGRDPDPVLWGRRFVVMAFITALSWGAAGALLFVPGSALHQVFLGGMIFASAASVLATTFASTPGYYAAIIPIFLPFTMRLGLTGGAIEIAIAGLLMLSFLMFNFFQYSLHKGLTESLRLRFEREALATALAEKNREVEKASAAKSRFLAAASHDLRQPMHAQALFLAELDARVGDPGSRAVVAHLRQSMQSMGELLDGLLDISELDAGAVRSKIQSFPVQSMLDILENGFSGMMAQKGLRYRVARCRHGIRSDPVLLERILRNFVHNGLRYTASGAVMVACRRRGAMLDIEVRDSGPGIPQERHQEIFGEFTQLSNPERKRSKGLGLGLAIVARLALLLRHDIEVRSRPGAGSTFRIRVPLAQDSTGMPANQRIGPAAAGGLAGMRVLVVEDDSDIVVAISLLLERWQCDALFAGDGVESAKSVRDAPDVIIADYRLPGEDSGIAVVRNIRRSLNTPVPAVLMTGDSAPGVLREARENDCILMPKPVDPEALYALLCNLRRHSSLRAS
jgi:signal transduction histidine kinase